MTTLPRLTKTDAGYEYVREDGRKIRIRKPSRQDWIAEYEREDGTWGSLYAETRRDAFERALIFA